MDKTEKAYGNAFEMNKQQQKAHGKRKKHDFNLVMMDSTFIYFHDIDRAGVMRCGFSFNRKKLFSFICFSV